MHCVCVCVPALFFFLSLSLSLCDLFANRPQCSPLRRGFHANAAGGKTKDEGLTRSAKTAALSLSHSLNQLCFETHVLSGDLFLFIKLSTPSILLQACLFRTSPCLSEHLRGFYFVNKCISRLLILQICRVPLVMWMVSRSFDWLIIVYSVIVTRSQWQ